MNEETNKQQIKKDKQRTKEQASKQTKTER